MSDPPMDVGCRRAGVLPTGQGGDVPEIGRLNTIGSSIYDTDSNLITNISVSNITEATGGANRETLDEIKRNAPLIFQTADREVTKLDHYAVMISEPTVSKVYIESERDLRPPNYDMFNWVNAYIMRKLGSDGNPQPITDDWLFGSSPTP